jgi:hypothetical protein
MRRDLVPHPATPSDAVSAITVEAVRAAPGRLTLSYRVTGADLAIPQPAAPERTDELWRHTCFEAFLRAPGAKSYVEFNLAPSGQWAAYSFEGYREGMAPLDGIAPPAIACRATPDGFELAAGLDLSGVPDLAGRPWRLGLSAVIEETSGRTSYWALAHPAGRADFHHDDGFALDLPAP